MESGFEKVWVGRWVSSRLAHVIAPTPSPKQPTCKAPSSNQSALPGATVSGEMGQHHVRIREYGSALLDVSKRVLAYYGPLPTWVGCGGTR